MEIVFLRVNIMRHFIQETDFDSSECTKLFELCKILKEERGQRTASNLNKQSWGLIFHKNSTRTRVSFEVGIYELGGQSVFLQQNTLQLERGETVADTARVLSRYLHGLIIRTGGHDTVLEFAHFGSIPVVNALTELLHPCQAYSDAFTLAERWCVGDDLMGSLQGRKVAFLGDTCSNVAHSWMMAAALFGMELALAGPPGFEPGSNIKEMIAKADLPLTTSYTDDVAEAVKGADVVYTDVWTSMGKEGEAEQRLAAMQPYQVSQRVMSEAKPSAVFMHCLPAHAGQEVTQEVIESPASIIFDQAENRLHMQKAILCLLSELNQQT